MGWWGLITPATSTTQDFTLNFKNFFGLNIQKNAQEKLSLDFGSQKSKLTQLEQVFQTAGVINPPPPFGIGLNISAKTSSN